MSEHTTTPKEPNEAAESPQIPDSELRMMAGRLIAGVRGGRELVREPGVLRSKVLTTEGAQAHGVEFEAQGHDRSGSLPDGRRVQVTAFGEGAPRSGVDANKAVERSVMVHIEKGQEDERDAPVPSGTYLIDVEGGNVRFSEVAPYPVDPPISKRSPRSSLFADGSNPLRDRRLELIAALEDGQPFNTIRRLTSAEEVTPDAVLALSDELTGMQWDDPETPAESGDPVQ